MRTTTVMTGKNEHISKTLQQIERMLDKNPDYIKGFYYSMRNSGKTSSYRTHKEYLKYVISFCNYINKDIDKVTMDDINIYLSRLSIKDNGKSTSGSYLVAVYSALKKFFKYLISSKRISENPMEHVERPAPKKSELVERTYLNKSEIKKLFKYIDKRNDMWKERDKALMTIFFFTGIRNTCLTEINIQNIDFENNCIYVIDKGTKLNTCYLSEEKMDIIKEWLYIRNKILKEKNIDTDALFINKFYNRLEPCGTAYIIKKMTKSIGHEISPHKARGSFATNAMNSGLSLYEVSKLMGHSSTKVTSDCYIQGQDERVKEAGLKISNSIKI